MLGPAKPYEKTRQLLRWTVPMPVEKLQQQEDMFDMATLHANNAGEQHYSYMAYDVHVQLANFSLTWSVEPTT